MLLILLWFNFLMIVFPSRFEKLCTKYTREGPNDHLGHSYIINNIYIKSSRKIDKTKKYRHNDLKFELEVKSMLDYANKIGAEEDSIGLEFVKNNESWRMGWNTEEPTFKPCTLVGPDGLERAAWEMWVGDRRFGKADTKELLRQGFDRMVSPRDFKLHWRKSNMKFRNRVSPKMKHPEYGKRKPLANQRS